MSTERDAEVPEREETLFGTLRHRLISLPTMSPRLRLLSAIAIAQLVVAAVVLALRDQPVPLVTAVAVPYAQPTLIGIPLPIFLAVALLVVLSWTYILAGFLHAHIALRVVGLALFTVSLWSERDTFNGAGIYRIPIAALVSALWLVGIGGGWYDRHVAHRNAHHLAHHKRLVGVTFGLVFAIIVALFALVWWSLEPERTSQFALLLWDHLGVLSVFLFPALILAGVDFAEWAELTAERGGAWIGRVKPPYVLAITTAVIALLVLWNTVMRNSSDMDSVPHILDFLKYGAVLLGGLAAVLAVGHVVRATPRMRIPYSILALSVGVSTFAVLLFMHTVFNPTTTSDSTHPATQQCVTLGPYVQRESPPFLISYPAGWYATADNSSETPTISFDGACFGHSAHIVVTSFSRQDVPTGRDAADRFTQSITRSGAKLSGRVVTTSDATTEGVWNLSSLSVSERSHDGAAARGLVWTRVQGERTWALAGWVDSGDALSDEYRAAFDAVVVSWQPGSTAHALAGERDETTGNARFSYTLFSVDVFGIASFVDEASLRSKAPLVIFAVIAFLLLALRAFPRYRGALMTSTVFLAAAALFQLFVAPIPILMIFTDIAEQSQPIVVTFWSVQLLIAAMTVVWLALLVVRRRLRDVSMTRLKSIFALNVSLVFVTWISALFGEQRGVRIGVIQGVIVLMALLWDVLMSGGSITNRAGRWFPRHARVLAYLGYIMVTAAAILNFSSWRVQATGAPLASELETDLWVQQGMVDFGVPVLLTVFALALWRRGGRNTERVDTRSV